jgi:hypothetical protein
MQHPCEIKCPRPAGTIEPFENVGIVFTAQDLSQLIFGYAAYFQERIKQVFTTPESGIDRRPGARRIIMLCEVPARYVSVIWEIFRRVRIIFSFERIAGD